MTAARVVGRIAPEPVEAPKPLPWLSATDLAKLIRVELKQRWPRTRFSVRSKSYSMGSSVSVSWTDGPTGGLVEAVLQRFEGKSFDGMTDSTNYHPIEIDGQRYRTGSYIHAYRRASRRLVERAYGEVCRYWGIEPLPDAIQTSGESAWVEDRRTGSIGGTHTISSDVLAVLHRRNALDEPYRWTASDYLDGEAAS